MAKAKQQEPMELEQWAPLVGKWEFTRTSARFVAPQEGTVPHGIALSPARLKRGTIRVTARLDQPTGQPTGGAARIVFGYDAETAAYFTAGIGGIHEAYVIDTFIPGTGWRALRSVGSNTNLQQNREYHIEVRLQGQAVRLSVDGIAVTEVEIPHPLRGDQVGLLAWGNQPVTFTNPTALSGTPRAFVVMQFAEPYDSLYKEVIKPVAEKLEFEVFRADDVFRPGIILQDITRSIIDADVVIAEVTPANPNVFYELGYAHAIGKPTVLLAEHPTDPAKHLPFDISGFRVIFYDDKIRGKRNVETMLRKHLTNIREGRLDSLP